MQYLRSVIAYGEPLAGCRRVSRAKPSECCARVPGPAASRLVGSSEARPTLGIARLSGPQPGARQGPAHHDSTRSTAWAVVSCAEAHRPAAILVENVVRFTKWKLYPGLVLGPARARLCALPSRARRRGLW